MSTVRTARLLDQGAKRGKEVDGGVINSASKGRMLLSAPRSLIFGEPTRRVHIGL